MAKAVKRAIEQIDKARSEPETAGLVRLERSSRIAQRPFRKDRSMRRRKCQFLQCWHSMPTWPSSTILRWQARWSRMLHASRQLAIDHARDDWSCWRRRLGDITVEEFKDKLKNVQQEEQLGWLTARRQIFHRHLPGRRQGLCRLRHRHHPDPRRADDGLLRGDRTGRRRARAWHRPRRRQDRADPLHRACPCSRSSS